MTWSSWGINLDVYDSFRHYIEIQTRRNEEHVPFVSPWFFSGELGAQTITITNTH